MEEVSKRDQEKGEKHVVNNLWNDKAQNICYILLKRVTQTFFFFNLNKENTPLNF